MDSTRAYVQQTVKDWGSHSANGFQMILIHKADNCIIGGTGFNNRSDITIPYFEIGYWLDSTYEGQGFMTECVNALTLYAFEVCHAIRMQIRAQVENTKSIAVAKRCGYAQEAILKHDRLDCVTHLPGNGVLLACIDTGSLFPLDVTWIQKKS